MNRRLIIGGIIFSLMLSLGGIASAATRTVVIRVKGMTCGGCAITIEQTLKATEGVEDVQVSYEQGEARIKYDDKKVTVGKLREVINSTGYQAMGGGGTVRGTTRRGNRNRTVKPKPASCGDAQCCATQ